MLSFLESFFGNFIAKGALIFIAALITGKAEAPDSEEAIGAIGFASADYYCCFAFAADSVADSSVILATRPGEDFNLTFNPSIIVDSIYLHLISSDCFIDYWLSMDHCFELLTFAIFISKTIVNFSLNAFRANSIIGLDSSSSEMDYFTCCHSNLSY